MPVVPSRRPTRKIPTALSRMSWVPYAPFHLLCFVPSFCWPVLAPNFNTAAEASGTDPCVESGRQFHHPLAASSRVSPPRSLQNLVHEVGTGAWRVFFGRVYWEHGCSRSFCCVSLNDTYPGLSLKEPISTFSWRYHITFTGINRSHGELSANFDQISCPYLVIGLDSSDYQSLLPRPHRPSPKNLLSRSLLHLLCTQFLPPSRRSCHTWTQVCLSPRWMSS